MTKAKKLRIAVIDRGFVSPYFGEFFTILNRAGDRDYVIFHGDPPRWVGLQAAPEPYGFPAIRVRNVELFRTAIYQTLVREIARGTYDAVILGHELKFLSNWLVAGICKAKGVPVILWGYGYHAPRGIGYRSNGSRAWSRLASGLKDLLASRADGYLAYTDRGAERMRRLDLASRVFVVRQSVNVHEQIVHHERLQKEGQASTRRRLGLDPEALVLLYVGRLVEAKSVDRLIDTVAHLNACVTTSRPVEARIIGGGECLLALRGHAEKVEGVDVLGEIYDQAKLADYFMASDALVLPGAAGITVTYAFSYGLPVIMTASELHSPEADYVVDGFNGLIAQDGPALLETVQRFANDAALRGVLAAGALATRKEFSMEHMARQFHDAVDDVLATRKLKSGATAATRRQEKRVWRADRQEKEPGNAQVYQRRR